MSIQKVVDWLDGGCSSWGVPEHSIRVITKDYFRMAELLKELRSELELYEADASGEHYNNPDLNAVIDSLLPPL